MKIDIGLAGVADPGSHIEAAKAARRTLEDGSGPGASMRGWLSLPSTTTDATIDEIERAAKRIRETDALVVIGIGGSFQGAAAVMDALSGPFSSGFPVHFAGHHLDAAYHADLLSHLAGARYSVNVISKSGGTTEPAAAFELFWRDLSSRFDDAEMKKLVLATTGATGALHDFATRRALSTLPVPEDVGGRYSVLTAVGLLPLAAWGADIRALLDGAREMERLVRARDNDTLENNPALAYTAFRIGARLANRSVELFATCAPGLGGFAQWWKQLFGESEGKNGGGLLPACLSYTTDLHSLGQWIQDGPPIAFETAIDVVEGRALLIPNVTGLCGQLEGRPMHDVNRKVLQAALRAHSVGNTPCVRIVIERLDEHTLGGLLYLMEYSCALSAYSQGVNPFDQPGVERYKTEARTLLRS